MSGPGTPMPRRLSFAAQLALLFLVGLSLVVQPAYAHGFVVHGSAPARYNSEGVPPGDTVYIVAGMDVAEGRVHFNPKVLKYDPGPSSFAELSTRIEYPIRFGHHAFVANGIRSQGRTNRRDRPP
jgi:hypothetical protein